jgi:P-type Cu+ transporter
VLTDIYLQLGKYLEAFSRSRAANAIGLLGQMRGSEALLLVPRRTPLQANDSSFAPTDDEMEKGSRLIENSPPPKGFELGKVPVDLLDVGDIVRVQPGSTPPADGTIVSNDPTVFDESSLTGESHEVKKNNGDNVFVGTINKSRAVDLRVDAIGGETMYVLFPPSSCHALDIVVLMSRI